MGRYLGHRAITSLIVIIGVTIIMFGPGAACASANSAEKSALDIHW